MTTALLEKEKPGIRTSDRAASFDAIYTAHYISHKSDSPEGSKASLLRRALSLGPNLTHTDTVVDLGSGRQVFMMRFLRTLRASGSAIPRFISMDIANIAPHNLPGISSPHASHIRANGEQIPLIKDSVAVLTSNMGLECMEEGGLAETYRVLRPGGHLVANIFDRSMLREEAVVSRPGEGLSVLPVPEFAMNMKSSPLLVDPAEIAERFAKNGLEITHIKEVTSKRYSWIEIDAVKSVTLKLAAERQALAEQRDDAKKEGNYDLCLPSRETGAKYQTEYDWILNQRKKEIRIIEIDALLTKCPETKMRLLGFKKYLSRIQKTDRSARKNMAKPKEKSRWVI